MADTQRFHQGSPVTVTAPLYATSRTGVLLGWSPARSYASAGVYGTYTLEVDGQRHRTEGILSAPTRPGRPA